MVVMVFGTFDILHPGHLDFFKQAKMVAAACLPARQGFSLRKKGVADFSLRQTTRAKARYSNYPRLIVVIARDLNVKKTKGHLPRFSEKIRLKNIKKLKIADKAVLGGKKDYFKVVKKEKPDIICLGYDQKVKIPVLKKKLKKMGLAKTKICRLKAYKPGIYKSSRLSKKN